MSRPFAGTSYGSGILVSPQGHILTINNHIVSTQDISVELYDGRSYRVKVVAREPELDIVMLRIEEEVPRGLTDTALPDRVIRRITVDGSRFPITEVAGDRLLDVRRRDLREFYAGQIRGGEPDPVRGQ